MEISSQCQIILSYFFLNLGSLLAKFSSSLVRSMAIGRPDVGGGTVRSHGIASAAAAAGGLPSTIFFFFLYSSKLMTVRRGADCSGFTEGTGVGNVGR